MALIGEGVLGPGGEGYFDVVLTGGVPHTVYVHPSEPGVDFDLFVYDENGILVTDDISDATDAFCIVTPRWTGPFRLVVKAARGLSTFRIVVEA